MALCPGFLSSPLLFPLMETMRASVPVHMKYAQRQLMGKSRQRQEGGSKRDKYLIIYTIGEEE